MGLIEDFMSDPDGIVGFNLVFDHFQLCKLYTMFLLCPDWSKYPIDMLEELALLEPKARFGPCIKPTKACDIMLHARRGPYQSMMNRDDVRIKRVPTVLAYQLVEELEERIPLKDIYFAKRKTKQEKKWQVFDIEDEDGEIDPNFKDVVLKFRPSSALKALAVDALRLPVDEVLLFGDAGTDDAFYPEEVGYAPFALAIGSPEDWKKTWPEVIHHHITHWGYNERGRKYAADDVIYTRRLWWYFDRPQPGDTESELACMAAAVRWKGFAINKEEVKRLMQAAALRSIKYIDGKRFEIPTAPKPARYYITEKMGETEKVILGGSTKKPLLEEIAKWTIRAEQHCIDEERKCKNCGLEELQINLVGAHCKMLHPAAIRAREVLEARQGNYEANFYEKLLRADRFHASMAITGALSGRMSGGGAGKGIEQGGFATGDKLNAQGVKRNKETRKAFTLADGLLKLCGGDFDGFEVTIAEAVYADLGLREELLSGKKMHGLFGVFLFPGKTYDQIVNSAGTIEDYYDKSKRCFFLTLYGGTPQGAEERIGIPVEDVENAQRMFGQRYPEVGRKRAEINNQFCSMRQPGGIGTAVEWHEPADYIESLLGFRRYFTLENKICKALFLLAQNVPPHWRNLPLRVQRRDRLQTVSGACQSALYAAAFALQAANVRSAGNHVIQSSGAGITKEVQRAIWDIQPSGIHEWLVQPLNIHDEIECPCHPSVIEKIEQVVNKSVESFREKVPLIKMKWKTGLKTWADK